MPGRLVWKGTPDIGDMEPAGCRGKTRYGELEIAVATVEVIAIALVVAAAVLFGGFVAICLAIRREDRQGTLAGQAPSRTCRGVRHMTGWHRTDWV
jgi:hypothetical protein